MIGPFNCKEVTTRLALRDRRHYPLQDRAMILFHLAICWVCRKYEHQMKVIGMAYGVSISRLRDEEDLAGFKERLQERLKKSQ